MFTISRSRLVLIAAYVLVAGTIIVLPFPFLSSHIYAANNELPNSTNLAIPSAKSVFETGTMILPPSVKGFIISLPDETHELDTANKTISHKNAHYLPSDLIIPNGTAVAFVHGDPNHIHVEVVRDNSTSGNLVWQTIPVKHPGSSDIKVLPTSGFYSISDPKYPSMKGTITVQKENVHSGANLVVGGFFCPTPSLAKYKSEFAANGFQILSQFSFLSITRQADIAGPTTLLIYSATMPMQDALTKLLPMLGSLPYL
jgi:plastocyanin